MSGSVNKCIIVGHLGRDPEIRAMGSGKRVANLSVATSDTWKDSSSGERKERTEWHRVTIYSDGLVGVVERYLKKGSKVYLEGQLQTRKYIAQNGGDAYSTEIVLQAYNGNLVMLDSPAGNGGARQAPARSPYAAAPAVRNERPPTQSVRELVDDDIPF